MSDQRFAYSISIEIETDGRVDLEALENSCFDALHSTGFAALKDAIVLSVDVLASEMTP